MIAPHLKIQPGQEGLTPEQETEARRFAAERIAAQLSTEPVEEPEVERLLQQAYEAAGMAAPRSIHWLSGPLQIIPVGASARVWDRMREIVWASVEASVGKMVWYSAEISIWRRVQGSVEERVWRSVYASARDSTRGRSWNQVGHGLSAGAQAYLEAPRLAFFRFFDEYLAPNEVHALARFNELVSGYWLGKREALLVRRPRALTLDAQGRLHSATGKCIEYPDGWGFYAWHGVRVPEKVILASEQLTKEDWSTAENVEVRRVIQERMGERCVRELGGIVIDTGPRGTLYEIALPGDPEQVARYVQVQDASMSRQYFLRVPPGITTAAEAVAWTFTLSLKDYRPIRET